jgi:hypothetical protein
MEVSESIRKAYQLIVTVLTEKFGHEGYQIVEEKEDDLLFGSRYTIWSNDKEMLRLTWNGKENMFLVEVSNDLPISAVTEWEVISMTAFNPASENSDYVYREASKVIKSVD